MNHEPINHTWWKKGVGETIRGRKEGGDGDQADRKMGGGRKGGRRMEKRAKADGGYKDGRQIGV